MKSSLATSRRAVFCKPCACAVLLCLAVFLQGAVAEEWPTFRHDAARSGVTPESLSPSLRQQWVFVPTHPPEVAWPDPEKEKPRVMFDEAYHVAVAGDTVYFGSSADHQVYALDAGTGAVRWTAFTEGPIRCAPTVAGGRVYVGSDDGCAYCFRGSDGALEWRVRGAFTNKKVLGNGKMISLWPVRTGVLVDDGVAYFGAGVFPHASTFVCAVDAETGAVIWRNDTCGELGAGLEYGGMTPQGYLLATEKTLYVPSGRAMPGAFDREDGRFLYYCSPGGKIGGTWALVADNRVVAGMEGKRAYDEKTGFQSDAEYAWFPGYQLIVAEDSSYLLSFDELRALDRKAHAFAGEWRKAVLEELKVASGELDKMRRGRDAIATAEREAYDKKMDELTKQLDSLAAQQKSIEDGVHKWRRAVQNSDAMILAGDTLVIGGDGAVQMIDAITGDDLWTAEVDGRAVGLAVANGHLYVSSDTGATYQFGPGGADAGRVRQPDNPEPYPQDNLTSLYAEAAEAMLAQSGVDKGFCLVYGSGRGRLALELARRSDMKIVGIDPDAENVAAARRALDAAGMYGRVAFEQGALDTLPFSDYFANLIVSDTMLLSGQPEGAAAELVRVLKPCGGVICLGQPAGASGMDPSKVAAWLAQVPGAPRPTLASQDGAWVLLARGALPGAGEWTHQYANAGNTACSNDERVKGPLGILWFGEPGPQYMVERHARTVAPVAMDGRLFVQGEHEVMAYDSYNGVLLWHRDLPGAVRNRVDSDMGNLALARDGLYVATHDKCVRLDPATGETIRTYDLPGDEEKGPRRWGYIACVDHTLFGTCAAPLQHDYGETWDAVVSDEGEWENLDRLDSRAKNYLVAQYPKPDERAYWGSQQGGLMWRDMANWPAWGSVAKPEGAITSRIMAGDTVFALDTETGAMRWVYRGGPVAHPTIAVADGMVFLADCAVTDAEKRAAIEEKKGLLDRGVWENGGEMQFEPQDADVRRLVALDVATGEKRWERVVDLTGCGGDRMGFAYQDGILLAFGCFSNHDKELFRQDQLTWRRVTAVDGRTGGDLWSKPLNYLRRPVVMADQILIEPRACDLRTGMVKTRLHPLTGKEETWEWVRPGHCCSATSAAPNMFFLRGYFLWYYDLVKDQGMLPFGGIRPGCWINTIPANGLVLFPEASAGCGCSYPVRCSVAMKPQEDDTTWGILIQHGDMTPVQHMAVNLGAPGDRRDADGTLWFGYPHPKGNSFYQYGTNFRMSEQFLDGDGMGFVARNFQGLDIENTDRPWLFAAAAQGLRTCKLPLIEEGQDPGVYKVRLYFTDLVNEAPGQRVFTVKLQGKTVLKDFDIVKAAGGPGAAVVQEFAPVKVSDDLSIELLPKRDNPSLDQAPLLNAIEVVREDKVMARAM